MKHHLVLNVGKEHPYFDIYLTFSQQLEIKGKTFLELICSELSLDGPFSHIVLSSPEDLKGLILKIPSHLVAFAYSSMDDKKLGF